MKVSRTKRGLKAYLCRQCSGGVIGEKTFVPNCSGCLAKKDVYDRLQAHCGLPADGEHHVMCAACAELARKPMRTGREPQPERYLGGNARWRKLTPEQRAAATVRHAKSNAARRKHERANVIWRRDEATT